MSLLTTQSQEQLHCKCGDQSKGTVYGIIFTVWVIFMGVVTQVRFPWSAQWNPVEVMRLGSEALEIHSGFSSKVSVTELTVFSIFHRTISSKRWSPLCPQWFCFQNVSLPVKRQPVSSCLLVNSTHILEKEQLLLTTSSPLLDWNLLSVLWCTLHPWNSTAVFIIRWGCFLKSLPSVYCSVSWPLLFPWASSFPYPFGE